MITHHFYMIMNHNSSQAQLAEEKQQLGAAKQEHQATLRKQQEEAEAAHRAIQEVQISLSSYSSYMHEDGAPAAYRFPVGHHWSVQTFGHLPYVRQWANIV